MDDFAARGGRVIWDAVGPLAAKFGYTADVRGPVLAAR